MFERKNQNVLSAHYNNIVDHGDSDSGSSGSDPEHGFGADSEDDFITLARADHDLSDDDSTPVARPSETSKSISTSTIGPKPNPKKKTTPSNPLQGILPASATAVPAASSSIPDAQLSKRALKIGTSKKAMLKYKGAPHKLTFDEEGDAHEVYDIQEVDPQIGKDGWKEMGKEYLDGIKERLEEEDKRDREEARERRREKKQARKEKEKLVSWFVWFCSCVANGFMLGTGW